MINPDNWDVEPHMRHRITYYAAGFGTGALGIISFNAVMSSTQFVLGTVLLLGIGFAASWALRARLVHKARAEGAILVALLLLLSAVFTIQDFRSQVLPEQVTSSPDMFMGAMLIWMMIICSFRLSNDRSVLFMCVPSLSLIGLTATFDPTTELLTYFALFLALACFILIRQNAFTYQSQTENRDGAVRLSSGSTKLHVGITASVTLVALVVGLSLGTLLYPILVQNITRPMSPFDASQFLEQITGEEFVPVATGPVDLSNQELLTVKCSRYLMLRGRVYNRYTGQGWISELTPDEQMWVRPMEGDRQQSDRTGTWTFILPKHPLYEVSRASDKVEQTVRIVSGDYRTVYAAAQPKTIKFHVRELRLRYASRMEAASTYAKGDSYTVVSMMNAATPRQLSTSGQDYPEVVSRQYLSVPETCWQIEKLTERVIQGEPDTYSKALAIQTFLQTSYTYDTSAPAAKENEDAVTAFLLKSKRGYCDIFATAMVIMARQSGIPARWVTGFAPGEVNPADGLYHVLAKDRHAWAELYFPGYGWVEFDATPSRDSVTWLMRLKDMWSLITADKMTLVVAIVVLLLFGYLIKTEVVDRLKKFRRPKPTVQETSAMEVSRSYRRMCNVLGRAGFPRDPSVTPWEYASWLESVFKTNLQEISSAVDTVTADFVEFRYSPREPSQSELDSMARTIRELSSSLTLARRQNLLPRNDI